MRCYHSFLKILRIRPPLRWPVQIPPLHSSFLVQRRLPALLQTCPEPTMRVQRRRQHFRPDWHSLRLRHLAPIPPTIGKTGKIGGTGTRPPQMPPTQLTPFWQCTPVRRQSQTPPIGLMSVQRTSAVVNPQHLRPAAHCPRRPRTQGELTGRGKTGAGRMGNGITGAGTMGVGMRPPQNPRTQFTPFWQCTPVRCQSQAPPRGAMSVQRTSARVNPQHLSPAVHCLRLGMQGELTRSLAPNK